MASMAIIQENYEIWFWLIECHRYSEKGLNNEMQLEVYGKTPIKNNCFL